MNSLENFIGLPLGYLMNFCYNIVNNYGIAIILFTIFTKIILMPVSIWVQKNSVKIVRLTPELNHIKVKYFGDKDLIAEKTSELYKKEKYNPFASIIPLLIQLILLMGLVNVIYNPLTHLHHVSQELNMSLIELTGQLTGEDMTSSSIQMTVVDTIKNQEYYTDFLNLQNIYPELSTLLPQIRNTKMTLMGQSLGLIPVSALGMTLLMPVMAAMAAWILCIGQNRLNPLQAEQGKWNQIGMTLFSVGISLFLGAFVPLGVGFYWICSNLFTLVQQIILNIIINPRKYIDYEELAKSKEELVQLENLGRKRGKRSSSEITREKKDYKRFFTVANKHLVVYSEGNGYWKYFKDIVEYLLEHSNIKIHYITNDPDDNIFKLAETNKQIRPYYIGEKRLITLMMKMDADIVLMTTPDLDNYHIKRSYLKKDIEYIFTNHGIGSDNLALRTHALDAFDTVFCVGPHIVEEERALEKLYGLRAKNLIETGYCLMDEMDREYAKMPIVQNEIKTILVAPSWQKDNLMDLCLDELINGLADVGYRIIIRPHPQYVRIYHNKLERILEKYRDKFNDNFIIETDFSSNMSVYNADLLITDWSNIGYEFSFTTYKPTLYINTPMKVMNPEWQKIDVIPIDIRIREQLGATLDLDKLSNIRETVIRLIENTAEYHDIIARLKEESFFNLGHSAEVSGKYIIDQLVKKQKANTKNEE